MMLIPMRVHVGLSAAMIRNAKIWNNVLILAFFSKNKAQIWTKNILQCQKKIV